MLKIPRYCMTEGVRTRKVHSWGQEIRERSVIGVKERLGSQVDHSWLLILIEAPQILLTVTGPI